MSANAHDDSRAGFIRQRRSLLIVSLVLTFAQAADLSLQELNVFGTRLAIGQPAAVLTALWVGWAYWLVRYVQYYHDMGEKGFLQTYRLRMMELVYKVAFKQVKRSGKPSLSSPPEWRYRLQLGDANHTFRSSWRYIVNFVLVAQPVDDDPSKRPIFEEQKGYEVNQRGPLAIAHLRAWLYVVFRTHLFSEYILPYIVALAPVAYLLYGK